jgi:rSAM/selenodomain-associated transferase 2
MSQPSFSISVIVPTVNEAPHIARRVAFLLQHGGGFVREVLVVDGESNDGTAREAELAGGRVIGALRRSRAHQMNVGAAHATGNVLYFVHADVELRPEFAQDIVESLQQGFDAGCYRYEFISPSRMLRINAWFTRFDRLMCRGGDQTLFIKREVFDRLNGFDEHYTIMEDYDFLIRLWKQHTFRIIPKNIKVSARKYETNSWLRVQLANLTVFLLFFLRVHPDRLKRLYSRLLTYR